MKHREQRPTVLGVRLTRKRGGDYYEGRIKTRTATIVVALGGPHFQSQEYAKRLGRWDARVVGARQSRGWVFTLPPAFSNEYEAAVELSRHLYALGIRR